MIFKGDGWHVVERNVERRASDGKRSPVEFFVFMPLQDNRGGVSVQVTPLVLRDGVLVAVVGKLEKPSADEHGRVSASR